MKQPDWTKAKTLATHWDKVADVFCSDEGWWDHHGDYYPMPHYSTWQEDRYVPRPVKPDTAKLLPLGHECEGADLGVNWIDGWPPVGWHGECTCGREEWHECVVVCDNQVAINTLGTWNIHDRAIAPDWKFHDLQAEVKGGEQIDPRLQAIADRYLWLKERGHLDKFLAVNGVLYD